MLVQLPTENVRTVKTLVSIKKPHGMIIMLLHLTIILLFMMLW
jgi:hypothetical protein